MFEGDEFAGHRRGDYYSGAKFSQAGTRVANVSDADLVHDVTLR